MKNACSVVFSARTAGDGEVGGVEVGEGRGMHGGEIFWGEAWAMMLATRRLLALAHDVEAHNISFFVCIHFVVCYLF